MLSHVSVRHKLGSQIRILYAIYVGTILTSNGDSECQLESFEEKGASSESNGKELENDTHTTVSVQQA